MATYNAYYNIGDLSYKNQKTLMAHNWQKWKSSKVHSLTCPCHEIYMVEAVGHKSSNYTLKIMIFCENVKFGAILLKFDISSITASYLSSNLKILLHL